MDCKIIGRPVKYNSDEERRCAKYSQNKMSYARHPFYCQICDKTTHMVGKRKHLNSMRHKFNAVRCS